MNTDKHRLSLNDITEQIIGCAYEVSNVLGCGFLEKVYYDDIVVGQYVADLLVEGRVLVEIKAVKELNEVQTAQCLNYLKATQLPVCLLINFGKPKVQIKRIIANV